MKLKFPGTEDLPRTTPAMQAYDRLTAAFPSTGTSHIVAVQAPAGQAAAVKAALTDAGRERRRRPAVRAAGAGRPEIEVSADGTVTVLSIATPFAGAQRRGRASRWTGCATTWSRPTLGGVAGAEYAVGGGVAGSVDYAAHVRPKLPLVVGVRAAADVPGDGVDVPLGGGRADLDRAEPALGGAAYGLLVAGVPGHLGGGPPGLHTRWARSSPGCRCSCSWCCSACRWTTTCSW